MPAFATAAGSTAGGAGATRGGGGGGRGAFGGRGRGRGGRGGAGFVHREVKLVESTPEEREEVGRFVDLIKETLERARSERGQN